MTDPETQAGAAPAGPGRSLWADAWLRLRRSRMAMGALAVIAAYGALALYGEAVYWRCRLQDRTPPYQQPRPGREYEPPGVVRAFAKLRADPAGAGAAARCRAFAAAALEHPLGTDNLGRDVLQRTIQGARIAFQVGIVTSLIAIPIGVVLGCLAGYFGGRADDFIVWLYSTFASIPGLLFILAIAMAAGKGLAGVYLGIGLTTWVGICRLIRAEVLKHKVRPYVTAARALGAGHARILFRHILPNVMHVVIISFSLRFPAAISTEVFMSFLGIGAQGEPSWGIMISNARLRLWQGIWWEMGAVTLAIFLVVLAFNLFGDALRDALDPRLRDGRQ